MKKLILSLLLLTGCAGKLSKEQIITNAEFILNTLEINSVSLTCSKDPSPDQMTCISLDKDDNPTVLACDNNLCYIVN